MKNNKTPEQIDLDKILEDLKGFKPLKKSISVVGSPVIRGDISTGYLIQILFFNILKFPNYGRDEKCYWHTFLSYKGYNFSLNDGKFGWVMYAEDNAIKKDGIINEIKGKIDKAINLLDKELKEFFNKNKNNKEIKLYLNNNYSNLISFYNFYRKQTNKIITKIDKNKPKQIVGLIDFLNNDSKRKKKGGTISLFMEEEKILPKYCFPMMLSFFSLLEFLLVVFFCFNIAKLNCQKLDEFRYKEWDEKFKAIFDLKNRTISRIYSELKNIKKRYRNPLTHGFLGKPSFLVFSPWLGIIPFSYKNLKDSLYYGFIEIEKDEAIKILKTFDDFINFITKNDPFRYYIIFLRSGLTIPANKGDIRFLKKKMNDLRTLKQYINEVDIKSTNYLNRE